MRYAFTIIELLVVLGISAVLVAISASVFFSIDRRGDLDSQARNLKSVLNLARSRTLASENLQSFGVHIDISANEYTMFSGAQFDSGNSENETFALPDEVTVAALDLQGGGNDIVFARLSGSVAQYGSITLQSPEKSTVICVSESGNIYTEESGCGDLSIEYNDGVTDADLASFPSDSGFGDPAQSFTTGASGIYARRIDLYIRRATANPSDLYLELRETNTVGNVLGRSRLLEGSSLPQTLSWVSFVFPNPVFLSANAQYFLRLRSLPSSNIASSGASGTLIWGYEHSASSPPAYGGGDAWRYVGRLANPADTGQQLGPADQYDFSFRIIHGIEPPPLDDSRHMEFNLAWSIKNSDTLSLTFHDPGNPDVLNNVSMADFFNIGNTEFDWEGDTDVYGDTETIRVHTHYIDGNDTILSIHRSGEDNSKAVDISIDTNDIVSYSSGGIPTVGANGGDMVYR